MRGGRLVISVVLVAALLFSPMLGRRGGVSADARPEGTDKARVLRVPGGTLRGNLVYSDGASPVGRAPVRLWSVSGEDFLQTVTTDPEGKFVLTGLLPGRYILVVGDRAAVRLTVGEDGESRQEAVVVVLPRGEGVFAQMAPPARAATLRTIGSEQGGEEAGEGNLLRTVLIGTGSAIVVVAVADATDVIEDDDDDIIIVSQPG